MGTRRARCSADDISDDVVTCIDGRAVTAPDAEATGLENDDDTMELYVDAEPSCSMIR